MFYIISFAINTFQKLELIQNQSFDLLCLAGSIIPLLKTSKLFLNVRTWEEINLNPSLGTEP